MATDDPITINEIPSAQWTIAMSRFLDGGAMAILPGEPPVGLQRELGFPSADGALHVMTFTETEPTRLTQPIAERDVASALATLQRARKADSGFDELLRNVDVVYEYLHDYGDGAVQIGTFDERGKVILD